MSEKINMTRLLEVSRHQGDGPEEWLHFATMALITQADKGQPGGAVDIVFPNREEGKDLIMDVDLKINGVEVQFSKLLERMVAHFEENSVRLAKSYVRDEVKKATSAILDATETFEKRLELAASSLENVFVENGLNIDQDSTIKREVHAAAVIYLATGENVAEKLNFTQNHWVMVDKLAKEYKEGMNTQ